MSEDRIAVLICSWGAGEPGAFDLEPLRSFAASMDGVLTAQLIERMCSEKGQKDAVKGLRESGADRFVVAACSPKTKSWLHRSIATAAGLHPLAFEVANIREGAAYVHARDLGPRKSEVIIRMAVEKVRLWSEPPFEEEMPACRSVAVVGEGLTAALAARDLAAQGLETDIIVPGPGFASPSSYIFINRAQRESALKVMREVALHPLVRTHLHTKVRSCEGRPGDFELILEAEEGPRALECGAVVLAPEPCNELRGLDGSLAPEAEDLISLGMRRIVILPGGPSSGTGCSCMTPRGLLYALEAASMTPGIEIRLLGRELRALGSMEEVQHGAQRRGVRFHRIEAEPSVRGQGPYTVEFHDPLVGACSVPADLVLVDSVTVPRAGELASVFRLPLDEKGELMSIESRLRPGETVRRGIYVCRYRVGNMIYEDVALEAGAAASRASELLLRGAMEIGGTVAEVEAEKCSVCLGCVRLCPYSAARIGEAGKAVIDVELCQGCGSCVSLCPSKAIDIYQYGEAQIIAQERAALGRSR